MVISKYVLAVALSAAMGISGIMNEGAEPLNDNELGLEVSLQ